MDMDLDHIWDLPIEHPPATTAGPSNQPLFIPSDDEGDVAATTQPTVNKHPDIDALFDGIDDLNELAPALDLDALRREADARNTRLVRAEISASIPTIQLSTTTAKSGGALDGIDGGDENGDGKKKRKPIAKLDEARLLGQNGLPQLVKDTKNFTPKGKGHEAADLDRVLQVYQFWTHRLYPKTRFKETVDRVEKLCHSKRMQVALSVWRDEAKGLINGVRLPPPQGDDDDSNSGTDSEDAIVPPPVGDATASGDATSSSQQQQQQPSSPARSRLRRHGSDSDGSTHFSDASSRPPPPSSPDRDEAASELDALLEEEALHAAAHANHAWKKSSNDNAATMDADDDLWATLDTAAAASAAAPTTAQAPPSADGDEEMWDVVAELEQEQEREKEVARQSNPVRDPPAAAVVDTHTDDMDDLYL